MATFAIEAEKGNATKYMKETHLRLQKHNLVENPFHGKIAKLPSDADKDCFLIHARPIYPKVYLLGLFVGIVLFLFQGLTLWLLLPALLFSAGFFWTKYFFYVMLRMGLNKNGYKGKVKLLEYPLMIKKCVETLNSV